MAEIDKFEAMEVRTRKQEEELARLKRNKKRNFIVGLSLTGVSIIVLIVVYCLAAFVWLADLTTLPYIEYTYSALEGTTTATITRLKADSDYPENFRIPAKVNGLTVTGIGPNAFAGCDRLEKVIMTDNIKWVGDYAFAGCTNLKEFEFSNSITHLGTGAFNDTYYLENLPTDGVSVVSQILFNVGQGIIEDNTVLLADRNSEIPQRFSSNEYNIVYISDWSQDVEIGGWGEALFQNNTGIVYAEVPDYLDSLPTNTFNGASNLQQVKFSKNVTSISDNAFANTYKLENITLGENVTHIGNNAFLGSGISSINLTDKIETLGDSVFAECSNLETFNWPGKLNVPASTFENCVNLKSINFGKEGFENITNIGDSAFANTGLVDITIPKNVSTIAPQTFENATKLETVRFYEGFKGQDIMGYPTTIGVKAIEPKAFRNTPLKEAILVDDNINDVTPKNKISLPNTIESFSTSSSNGLIFSGSFDKEGNYVGPVFDTFEFPAFSRSSAYQMFKNQIHLKNVIFNTRHSGTQIDGIKKIGYQSFYGCISIEELNVPNTVATIEGFAFANMDKLTKIHLPEEGSGLKVINRGLFANSPKLKSINISKDIFTFKEGAFDGNYDLDYVYIPFDENPKALALEKETIVNARPIQDGQKLSDEEKMPIFLSVERDAVNKTYVKEPKVDENGNVTSKGFYDPLTCKSYYLGEWHFDANGNPVVGKAVEA